MAAELVREKYHGAEAVSRTEQAVLQRWRELLELLERHRASLAKLAQLMALLREADATGHTLGEMKVTLATSIGKLLQLNISNTCVLIMIQDG